MNARDNFLGAQEITAEVLLEKYAKGNETTATEIRRRVARALSNGDPILENRFFDSMEKQGGILGGRINSAAGTEIAATLINCFVQPVGDTMIGTDKNGFAGIMVAAAQAAETMRRGGGVGYDFSRIRPMGAMVKGTQSRASGPISFMRVFDKLCETVESAGSRRGAQMGVLRVDHPDLEAFIGYKKKEGEGANFNVSIGVTDAFMEAVRDDTEFELVHEAEPNADLKSEGAYQRDDGKWVYRKVQAREIWELVMRSTYDFAEPGVLYLDRINRENNLYYIELIEATNPCGEQCLPPYGCCCLGSINLNEFVRNPFSEDASFDMEAFEAAVAPMVEMLDTVLDQTHWPLEEQKAEAEAKRRIGLGYTGLGDMLIMLGLRYDSEAGRQFATKVTEAMRDAAYRASIELAKQKGAFPLFDAEKYLAGDFVGRLPEDIKEDIRRYGIRNSHLLSIAPTGTISLAFADNASNGIEPPFSWTYTRTKRMADGTKKDFLVEDHAYRVFRAKFGPDELLPDSFVNALQISALDHEKMVAAVAPFIDAAISKTVNVPADYPYEDFKNLYMAAWEDGLKGITTYRPNATLGSVLSVEQPKTDAAPVKAPATIDDDPLKKQLGERPMGALPAFNVKVDMSGLKGKYEFYFSISFDSIHGVLDGQKVVIERPVEVFFPASQADEEGEAQQWITASAIEMSEVMQSGGNVARLLRRLQNIRWEKGQVRHGFIEAADGTPKPKYHKSEVAALHYAIQKVLQERGFLDSVGNQVPSRVLAKQYAMRNGQAPMPALFEVNFNEEENGDSQHEQSGMKMMPGKTCKSCGANAVIKIAGCEKCTSCGEMGSCG